MERSNGRDGKGKNKPCIHESNGRHWWKSKWTPQGVEKKRTDTYPNLCYLATDLWTYSITSWLTKGITVGGGLRPIRLEYKNITPFFLNNRKWKVNTRLFSCCGHNKYILSHENQRVRPRCWAALKSRSGFLQLLQAAKDLTSSCWSPGRSCHRLQKVLDQANHNCKRPWKPCETEGVQDWVILHLLLYWPPLAFGSLGLLPP